MRPQPISRFSTNGLFQFMGKHIRNFSFDCLFGSFSHQFKLSLTISPTCLRQFTIKDREVHYFCNTFSSIQESSLLPHKSSPIPITTRPLVCNQTYYHIFSFTLQFDNFTCSRMFRNIISTETGTNLLKQFIQIFILQWFVNLYRYIARLHDRSHSNQPFIVGIMGNHHNNTSILFRQFQILFCILINHPLAKIFSGHMQQFQVL